MSSVDAVHARLICVVPAAVAVSAEGALGGVVSGVSGRIDVFMSVWISAAESARL